MVVACGVIWLAALAVGVVAAVALARLASGHAGGGERPSSWLLYTIIAVSAVIIAGSVPLLMRARRGTSAASAAPAAPADEASPLRPPDAATENMRVFGVDPYADRRQQTARAVPAVPAAVLDRLWLRGTVALLGVMGLGVIAAATGSYLLASGTDTGAWVAFGVAGVITVAMPAVLAFYQRQLAQAVDEAGV